MKSNSLDFRSSLHPLELFAVSFDARQCVPACEMDQHVGEKIRMVGWLITEKSAQTNQGEPMEFATFEDLTGLYDATFFPKTYRRFGHLLSGGKPYLMEGLVEEEFCTVTLTVHKIWVLVHLSGAKVLMPSVQASHHTL